MSKKQTLLAILLVSGTAIGAGMLALPVATALAGTIPSLCVYLFCWLFSLSSGLLFTEALFWSGDKAHFLTMGRVFFGKKGATIVWMLYLFLFYSLMVAYMSLGGGLLQKLFFELTMNQSMFFFALFFGIFIIAGTKIAGQLNHLLMWGLILSYGFFVLVGASHIDVAQLFRPSSWNYALWALPIVFTSFSYQGTLPTIYHFLEGDVKAVRRAVIIGSSIPFVVYLLWDFLIKSIIPIEGQDGLAFAKTAVDPLQRLLPHTPIYLLGQLFAFFAGATSLIGVSLGLIDFLADSFKLAHRGRSRLFLGLVVFVPPTLLAMLDPFIFLRALGYAGGIGCSILLGLFPVAMVWKGRYYLAKPLMKGRLGGGKVALSLLALFALLIVGVELHRELFS